MAYADAGDLSDMDETLEIETEKTALFKASVTKYLMEEHDKIDSDESVWHGSSDIIESLFGSYKFRRSPDSLTGVRSHVLLPPLLTSMSDSGWKAKINIKEALERVFLRDMREWEKKTFSKNQSIKRKIKFSA